MDGATVSVAVVTSRTEAELIVGLLRSHGLRAASAADDAGGQEPQLQLQGVRVLVASSNEAKARRLLAAAAQEGSVMTAQWPVPAGLHRASIRLPIEGELPSSDGVTGWLNSAPLTAGGLQGRVVLVNFWTYTCINWLRQLPYVRAWNARYAAHGLVMVGVHTRVRVRERRRQHQPSSVGKGPTRDNTGATD